MNVDDIFPRFLRDVR